MMGLTLRGDFPQSPSYSMGYMTFNRLRMDIAYTVSDEFGQHYAMMPEACAGLIDTGEYDRRTEELIRRYRCRERFLSFLYQKDICGRLSPFKCKALLDGIGSMQSGRLYGYTAYPESCMHLEDFRSLLRECFARRRYLVWS